MMKFFRKHQKAILILMAVLMVLFIAGSMLLDQLSSMMQQWSNPRGPTIGTYSLGGKPAKISRDDIQPYAAELELLGRMSQRVNDQARRYVQNELGKEGAVVWYMWMRLVEHYGIRTTEADRKAFFAAHELTDEAIDKLRDSAKTTISSIYTAVDHLIAVEKLTDMMELPVETIPEYDVRLAVRDVTEIAEVRLVTPDVERLKTAVAAPSEARLKELFDRYKNTLRRDGPGGTGYRIPSKVALELLLIDAEQLANRPELLGIGEQDAFQYWKTHKGEFTETVQSAPDTQPGTQPAELPKRLKPFAEARAEVMRRLALAETPDGRASPAASLAEQILNEAMNLADAYSREHTGKAMPYGTFGEKDSLAEQIESRKKVAPKVYQTRLFSVNDIEEMSKDPETKNLTTLLTRGQPIGPDRRSLLQMAFLSDPLLPTGQARPADFEPLKLHEQREVYRADNKFFIWRLIKAEPDHPPADLNAVRDQVVADAKAQAAMDLARLELSKIQQRVKDGALLTKAVDEANLSLTERVKADKASTQPATRPEATARPAASQPDEFFKLDLARLKRREMSPDQRQFWMLIQYFQQRGMKIDEAWRQASALAMGIRPQLPRMAPSTKVVDAAFDLAAKASGTTRPQGELAALVDDPAADVVALIQFVDLEPATDTDYLTERPAVLNVLKQNAVQRFEAAWFNRAEFYRRLDYKPSRPERERPEEE